MDVTRYKSFTWIEQRMCSEGIQIQIRIVRIWGIGSRWTKQKNSYFENEVFTFYVPLESAARGEVCQGSAKFPPQHYLRNGAKTEQTLSPSSQVHSGAHAFLMHTIKPVREDCAFANTHLLGSQ